MRAPTSATLVFDARHRLIRIHKQTLHMLNNPEYIQILVNPNDKIVALRPANPNITKAERINWNRINDNHCCEMYSKSLINQLINLLPESNNICSIKLKGTHYQKENLIAFNMMDAQTITEDELL